MIAFTYADNSDSISRALQSFEDALADNVPALAAVADDFREMVAQQFASEGRAEGTPWPARVGAGLAPPSRRTMRASPLLVRTGALRDSLTTPGAAGSVEELDGGSLTLGTRLPYAMFHQLGTRRMPARPLIVLSDERSQRWTEIISGAIEEKTALLGAKELGGKG
jgi:phage gpG-like protein